MELSVELPSWRDCPGDRPAFVGADLSPATVAAGFRAGFFPWPPANDYWQEWHDRTWGEDLRAGRIGRVGPGDSFALPWWAPDPRGVLAPRRARLRSSLARFVRHSDWTSTADRVTSEVIRRCGPERGQESWLGAELAASYAALAEDGLTHSIEIWAGEELVAGVFGVLIGGIFSLESGFGRSNAGTLAALDLAARFGEAGGELIDLHMVSRHTATLGAEELPREQFHTVQQRVCDRTVRLPDERRPVARLVEVLLIGSSPAVAGDQVGTASAERQS